MNYAILSIAIIIIIHIVYRIASNVNGEPLNIADIDDIYKSKEEQILAKQIAKDIVNEVHLKAYEEAENILKTSNPSNIDKNIYLVLDGFYKEIDKRAENAAASMITESEIKSSEVAMYLVDNARSKKELTQANIAATQVIDASRSRTESAVDTLIDTSQSRAKKYAKKLETDIREAQYKILPKTTTNIPTKVNVQADDNVIKNIDGNSVVVADVIVKNIKDVVGVLFNYLPSFEFTNIRDKSLEAEEQLIKKIGDKVVSDIVIKKITTDSEEATQKLSTEAKHSAEQDILDTIADDKLASELIDYASYKIDNKMNNYKEKLKTTIKNKVEHQVNNNMSTSNLLELSAIESFTSINSLLNDANILGKRIASEILSKNSNIFEEVEVVPESDKTRSNDTLLEHINFRNEINHTSNKRDTVDRVNSLRVNDSSFIGKTISEVYDELQNTK